jgi:pimeloyl-ACP methyl ester carboxylesterase
MCRSMRRPRFFATSGNPSQNRRLAMPPLRARPLPPGAEIMQVPTAHVVQPEVVRAAVHAAGARMEYWRGGSGPAVLLTHASTADPDWHAPWLRVLAGRFRVFAPYPWGEEDQPLALRLQHFLDGLGLERVGVITDQTHAAEVLWLALAEPERIERIVIVLPEHPDPECLAWLPPDRIERSRQPVLVMRLAALGAAAPTLPAEAAMDRMLSFLAGDG